MNERSFEGTDRLALHRTMLRIRRFEEKVSELHGAGRISGSVHLCIGQEAIPTGVLAVTTSGLAFIELGSRRIFVSPSTAHPDSAWVTQQARNLAMELDDRSTAIRFLIRDRDTKFSRPFDDVVRSAGARVILTPVQAPNANAYAERVIETIQAECLDWSLILGRRHLDRTLRTYAEHYNGGRPHRGLDLATPLAEAGEPVPVSPPHVHRRDLLGGLIHEYHGAAA